MTRSEATGLWYKRIERFNLVGHVHFLTFSCHQRMPLLTNDVWCAWLAESLVRCVEKHEMALWAYVFMPEHVHLLVKPLRETYDVSGFLKSLKNSSSKRILTIFVKRNCQFWISLKREELPPKSATIFGRQALVMTRIFGPWRKRLKRPIIVTGIR
jgi:putative transposase